MQFAAPREHTIASSAGAAVIVPSRSLVAIAHCTMHACHVMLVPLYPALAACLVVAGNVFVLCCLGEEIVELLHLRISLLLLWCDRYPGLPMVGPLPWWATGLTPESWCTL